AESTPPGRHTPRGRKMNVRRKTTTKTQVCENGGGGGEKKHGLVRKGEAERAKKPRRTQAAKCRKPLVSPKAFGQSFVSDQTKTDSRNCGPKEPTGHAQQHLRDERGCEARPKRQDQRRACDRRYPERN